jgi:predicted membrane protein
MKTKYFIIPLLIAITTTWASAQEFKVNKSSGKLDLRIGRVTVEGHSGNEIIFTSSDGHKDKDDRAQGLRSISGSGLEDNTGLGINVTENGSTIVVNQLKKTNSPNIRILVPKGVIVSFNHESQYGGKAKFKNMENEIEVQSQYNSIELENVSGPITVNSIYGSVDATFTGNVKGPINIVSVYGHVDVALPVAIKADLTLSTSYGEIMAAPEFKIEVERTMSGGLIKQGGDDVRGKVNGGGMNIKLEATYGKVYLRKN